MNDDPWEDASSHTFEVKITGPEIVVIVDDVEKDRQPVSEFSVLHFFVTSPYGRLEFPIGTVGPRLAAKED